MYGKLYEQTFTGSMVGKGPVIFATWAYVIAHAKPPGVVELNPALIAAAIGCKKEEIDEAIAYLCAPDENSRSKDQEGRRLVRTGQFAYSIPTFEHYHSARNHDERRTYNRIAKRKSRAKSNRESLTVNDMSARSAQQEQNQDQEPEVLSPSGESCVPLDLFGNPDGSAAPDSDVVDEDRERARWNATRFETFWTTYDRKVEKKAAWAAWRAIKADQLTAMRIIAAAEAYAKATEPAYRKHPHRWLKGRCWEDEDNGKQRAMA